jgi:hypothetical protein
VGPARVLLAASMAAGMWGTRKPHFLADRPSPAAGVSLEARLQPPTLACGTHIKSGLSETRRATVPCFSIPRVELWEY